MGRIKDNESKAHKRIESIDILKGIGIFFMVLDHVGAGRDAHIYIQSFHMPLFFLVSGYLWKKNTVEKVAKRRFKTLLIPYICFGLLYFLLYLFTGHTNQQIMQAIRASLLYPTDMEHMPFAPALWFLPCIFFVDIIYTAIIQKVGRDKGWFFPLVFASPIIAWSYLTDIMLPFCIEPTAMGLVFWCAGDSIKEHTEVLKERVQKWPWLFFFLGLQLIFSFANGGSCDMRSARYHNLLFYFIAAFTGVFVWYGISLKIEQRENCIKKLLISLGVNSMSYLCMNQIMIAIWKYVFEFDDMAKNLLAVERVICFVFAMMACFLMDKIIKKTPFRFILGCH